MLQERPSRESLAGESADDKTVNKIKSIEDVRRRLKAEETACKIDPSLNDNEWVQSAIWMLHWFLGEVEG